MSSGPTPAAPEAAGTRPDAPSPGEDAAVPLLSVVVPSIGREAGLARLMQSLGRQTLPRGRFEIVVALDREPTPGVVALLARAGARHVRREDRSGPGAARNAGAATARGEWLAFTEDDCVPADDWLERAAERIGREPGLDALEGTTVKPGGRAVHRQSRDVALYLPTNLFVKRAAFERVGGYREDYFDPETGLYFREDADFGFRLAAAGARIGRVEEARVEHPEEHAGPRAAVLWAMRHAMDPLLARRHPEAFRRQIEIHRLGPFVVRRPVVRAAVLTVAAALAAAAAAGFQRPRLATAFAALALGGVLVVWAKWRFRPSHLGAALVVPFVLVLALARGWRRARRIERRA